METTTATILVIDDDRQLCEMVERMLGRLGYAVEIATSGAAGLERIAAGGVDLVLLDIMMPGLDGIEVCRRIRADESQGYIPIIMMTGVGTESTRRAGFAAGTDDFVVKPFTQDNLAARVQVWVQARQRLQTAHAQLRQLADRVLYEQAQVQALTERLTAVLEGLRQATDASDAIALRDELEAIAAALAARAMTFPLRA